MDYHTKSMDMDMDVKFHIRASTLQLTYRTNTFCRIVEYCLSHCRLRGETRTDKPCVLFHNIEGISLYNNDVITHIFKSFSFILTSAIGCRPT